MEELIEAYKSTRYRTFSPALEIKVGIKNHELDSLLQSLNVSSWAYITAFNPFSRVLSEEDNLVRHQALKDRILNYNFFEGEGVGADESWKPETSFLITGISRLDAMSLGKEFEQNAIVFGVINGLPELILLV